MILPVVRGTFRMIAGAAGLLLVYGAEYAMEGMTTRIPISMAYELAITSLLMLPWALLFCSGVEDLGTAAERKWVFWVGATFGLLPIYYFEAHTSSSILTKVAMPPLAIAGGVLPHVIPRIGIAFTLCSIAAGIGGFFVLLWAFKVWYLGSFATIGIGVVITTFGIAATGAGILSILAMCRSFSRVRP
jgi:hypothetical protein